MGRSGIIALADAVRVYFEANNVQAHVARVGLKYRTFLTNQGPDGGSRVVFIPGDFNGDPSVKPIDEGELDDPLHHVSVNPRELAEWRRVVTASIWGVDYARIEDEEAQIQATEDLFEWTLRAIQNAVKPVTIGEQTFYTHLGADVERGKVTRAYPPLENGYGHELLWRFVLKGPFYDLADPTVVPTPGPIVKDLSLTGS